MSGRKSRLIVAAGGWIAASIIFALLTGGCDGEKTRSHATAAGSSSVGSSGGAPVAGFSGVFHSGADGELQILNLSERAGRISGVIGSAAIDARSDGDSASGTLRDPGSGATLGTVKIDRQGDRLLLAITVANPETGQSHTLPTMVFTAGLPPPVDVQFDARLVGRWRYPMPSAQSDESRIDVWMVLNPDGSIEHGRATVAGEPTLASIVTSGDDGFSGRWRSSDGVLHILPLGKSQWIEFAHYDVQGGKLLLTYNDGARQTYQRE